MRAYDIGLTRKSIEQQNLKRLALRTVEHNEFLEIEVLPGAPMAGHTLAEFPCSNDYLIISILRRGQPMLAHGNTKINIGDVITAYARPDVHEVVLREFGRPPHPEHSAEPAEGLQKHGASRLSPSEHRCKAQALHN